MAESKTKSLAALRTLLPFVFPFRKQLSLAAVALLLDAGLTALRPWPLKVVIDRVMAGQETRVPWFSEWVNAPGRDPMTLLYFACLATILIAIGTGMLTYFYTLTMGGVTQKLVYNLRTHLFSRLQRLSLRFHSNQRLGDTMTRLTSDIGAIQTLMARGSLMFFSNALLIVFMLGMMLWLNWKFTLIACSVAPLLFGAVWYHTRKIKRSSRTARDHDGELAAMAQESLSAIHMVKGMAQEGAQDHKFKRQGKRSLDEYLRRVKLQARMAPIVDILAATGLALVMFFGAKSVLEKTMTIGDVVVFFAYVTNFYSPMRAMSRQASAFAKAAAGAERVAEVLQSEIDVVEKEDAQKAPPFEGRLEFDNVSFQYEDQPILKNLSFTIAPGETVAIVGPTGAGKSTIASLLLRLYDPISGSVKIDGHDIQDFKTDSMRTQIGIVLQESVLLKGTIADNIAFGAPHATEEKIEEAARLALVDEFAQRLPDGLDHPVSERGSSLSGGQRQRIAIARAILRDTPILILDEPTSSLDVTSEATVLEAIGAASRSRTTVIITHRMAAAQMADRILMLVDGEIREEGTYQQLVARKQDFWRLVSS